jgi:hypothetical protein
LLQVSCRPVLRGLAAAALAILPLTVSTPAHAAETVPLSEAIARLPMAVESRDGYDRDAFKHWNAGANPSDGCNIRAEVLIAGRWSRRRWARSAA